jgi:hypothetical protein
MQKVGKYSLQSDGSVTVNLYNPKGPIGFIHSSFANIESKISQICNKSLVLKATSDAGGEVYET